MGIWKLKNDVLIRNRRDLLQCNLNAQLGLILVVSASTELKCNWCSCLSTFPFLSLPDASLQKVQDQHYKRQTLE